jgi:hypothetical protein
MRRSLVRTLLLSSLLALVVACGDQSLFMSLKNDTTDLQLTSVSDGQVVAAGKPLPLMIAADNPSKGRDVEVEITLTSAAGQSVWHNRTAAVVNEQMPIALPADLAPGMYKLDLVLYSAGEVAQKKSASFFVAGDGWKITGIKSFPPVITAAASVMLKAELQVPQGVDAYLRWSWKSKVIAKGPLSKGFDQVLWTAPSDVGVYTITLELFPSLPPAGSDFPFTSSLVLSTDIFVSNGKTVAVGDLGPESSYLSLLHLQANLNDVGAGAKALGKTQALPIGNPQVVSLEDSFGYRLDGNDGIRVPWLSLPLEAGAVKPFTVSVDLTVDDLASGGTLVSAATADNGFTLAISLDPEQHAPQAVLSAAGAGSIPIPWNGPALAQNQRYLLSLSVVPQAGTLATQWFLDGVQVSQGTLAVALPAIKQDGATVIGGEKGFKGVVDEFGVYSRDPAGRPATDPDLFLRAQAAKLGQSLVLANGFDGMYLPDGWDLEGSGKLAAGSLTLPPGAALELPAVKPDGSPLTVTAALGAGSAAAAVLTAQWDGAGQKPQQYALASDGARTLRFRVSADGSSLTVSGAGADKSLPLPKTPSADAGLLLKIGNPADAAGSIVLDSLVAAKDRK